MARADEHCPECGVYVKPANLPAHLRKAHGQTTTAAKLERQARGGRTHGRSRPFPVWLFLLVVLIVAGASFAYWSSRGGTNETPLTEMCVQHTGGGIHWHAQLNITLIDTPYPIPANIGIVSSTCYRPLHTHEQGPGLVHIELPGLRTVYLRDFFAIWGKQFSQDRILTYTSDATHEVVMFVGGTQSQAYENLVLQDNMSIFIEYRNR
jgi:hypothetical protein